MFNSEYGDFYSDVQRNMKRIGDIGDESDDFKKRAYKQFHNHDFTKLAKIQDEFVASDPRRGSEGREKNRNLNRMEYDFEERTDGHTKEEDLDKVSKKIELKVSEITNAFKKHGWTLNSTASAVSDKPITQKDYKDQIKM